LGRGGWGDGTRLARMRGDVGAAREAGRADDQSAHRPLQPVRLKHLCARAQGRVFVWAHAHACSMRMMPACPLACTHTDRHEHLLDVGDGILVLCPGVSVVRLRVHKNVDDGREGEDVGHEAGHHQPVAHSALEYPDLPPGCVYARVDFQAGTATGAN